MTVRYKIEGEYLLEFDELSFFIKARILSKISNLGIEKYLWQVSHFDVDLIIANKLNKTGFSIDFDSMEDAVKDLYRSTSQYNGIGRINPFY